MKRSSTLSAEIRRHLDKNPNVTAKELHAKFKASLPMAYKLLAERKKPARKAEIAKILKFSKEQMSKDITLTTPQNKPSTIEGIDLVNHPPHYTTGGIETIDFIEAKKLDYHLGNAVKYISRANHKGSRTQDLQKAIWYINRALQDAQP